MTQDVTFRELTPQRLGCGDYAFQKIRRAAADVMAKGEIYLLVDDDVEPVTNISIGVDALITHPQFAMLSAWPVNASIHRWTPEKYDVFESLQVTEHFSVGGLRVVRRGCMTKGWPEQKHKGYDTEHCEQLRVAGWRVGYSQFLRMIHHGEGKSDLYPKIEDEVRA